MKMLTFFRFMRQILRKKPADLDWIQRQGLIAVKLAQIFALRTDLLGVEKARLMQQLYQHTASIASENLHDTIDHNASNGFMDAFESI